MPRWKILETSAGRKANLRNTDEDIRRLDAESRKNPEKSE
jgi:hypothetical protein